MKPKLMLRALCIPASALFLTSCYVTPGVYDVGYNGYDPGYYGGGYYSGGVWYNNGHHHHGGHGHGGHRYYGKSWRSVDDVRLNADHRTSAAYRDPHNGLANHGHDAAGHRVDSRGHHVDQFGNHAGSGGG